MKCFNMEIFLLESWAINQRILENVIMIITFIRLSQWTWLIVSSI